MRCEDYRRIRQRPPSAASLAEVAASLIHTQECQECSKWFDAHVASIDASLTKEELARRKVLSSIGTVKMFEKLAQDPETREMLDEHGIFYEGESK